MVDPGSVTLNSRHVGWETAECFACHPKANLYSTDNGRIAHSVIFNDDRLAVCGSCHGGNGKVIDNSALSGCTNCHRAEAGFIPINKRFISIHTKIDNLTVSSVDCRLCHNISNHPEKSTKLNIIDNFQCLLCHKEHGAGLDCSSCHDQDSGIFYRGKNGEIIGHSITIPEE